MSHKVSARVLKGSMAAGDIFLEEFNMRKYILSLSVGCACLLVFSALTTAETWTTKWE